MSVTFKCHDVEEYEFSSYAEKSLEKSKGEGYLVGLMNKLVGPGVEATNINLQGEWIPWLYNSPLTNPLISSMLYAYNQHWEMVFSPDDIWLTIANGFAKHINLNAEELRSKFVDWDSKKNITVRRDTFVKGSPTNDWPGAFEEFSDQIAKFIGKKRDLIVSDFSTTGPVEKAASEVVLMDAMQAYFSYTMRTMSGFSKVTLLGETSDWESIKVRVQNLAEYDLEWWTKHLEPVIDQFVAASKGNVDQDFWQRAVNRWGGSGRDDVGGWVTTFMPYLKKNKKNPCLDWVGSRRGNDVGDFTQMVSKAPFKWEYYSQAFDMEFAGGPLMPAIDIVGKRVRMATGWAIRDKSNDVR